jgi:hypothetical protein
MEGKLRVSVVASGIDILESEMPAPNALPNQTFVQRPSQAQPVQVVRVGAPAQPAPQYAQPAAPIAQAPIHTPSVQQSDDGLFDDMPSPPVRRPYVRPQLDANPAPRYNPPHANHSHEAKSAPEPRRGLDLMGIFGAPKPRMQMEEPHYDDARVDHNPFSDDTSDDYSIPAFLRRQAN